MAYSQEKALFLLPIFFTVSYIYMDGNHSLFGILCVNQTDTWISLVEIMLI
jgi:hypothetical protein